MQTRNNIVCISTLAIAPVLSTPPPSGGVMNSLIKLITVALPLSGGAFFYSRHRINTHPSAMSDRAEPERQAGFVQQPPVSGQEGFNRSQREQMQIGGSEQQIRKKIA